MCRIDATQGTSCCDQERGQWRKQSWEAVKFSETADELHLANLNFMQRSAAGAGARARATESDLVLHFFHAR